MHTCIIMLPPKKSRDLYFLPIYPPPPTFWAVVAVSNGQDSIWVGNLGLIPKKMEEKKNPHSATDPTKKLTNKILQFLSPEFLPPLAEWQKNTGRKEKQKQKNPQKAIFTFLPLFPIYLNPRFQSITTPLPKWLVVLFPNFFALLENTVTTFQIVNKRR